MRYGVVREIQEMDGATLNGHGERESAGQVYFEVGVRAPARKRDDVAERLRELVEGTDWRFREQGDDGGKPYTYDHDLDRERPSHFRIKQNLYNEHALAASKSIK